MSGNYDIYDDIRRVYVRPIAEEHLDVLLQRVIAEIPTRSAPVRRRRRTVPRIVVVLAALTAIGGIAAAAPAIIDHFFHANAPIAQNVQRLQGPGTPMSSSMYEQLAGPEGTATTAGFKLAPRSASRILSSDAGTGELAAAPAVDGRGFCFVQELPGDVPELRGCEPALADTGLALTSLRLKQGTPQRVFGFAADGVERITIVASDGREYPATLVDNAFYWVAPTSSVHGVKARVEYPDRAPLEQPVGPTD